MKCLVNGLEVMYPCSHNCPLYGDCMVAFDAVRKSRVRTNADRIRAMSDEELADALMCFVKGLVETEGRICAFEEGFREELLHQLQQPVKDGDNDGNV